MASSSTGNVGEKGGERIDSPPPDSWELADVDERIKNLSLKPTGDAADIRPSPTSATGGKATSKKGPTVILTPTSAWDGQPIRDPDVSSLLNTSSSANSLNAAAESYKDKAEDKAQKPKDLPVDSFLYEALQNPRDRLTILRMEQEVLKFLKDPKQLLMEFPPMTSSYHRAAAHRVAQHYYLITTAVDAGEASTVAARKASIGGPVKYPPIRLLDIPAPDMSRSASDGSNSSAASAASSGMTAAQLKLAIMQRPKDERGQAAGSANAASSSSLLTSTTSVEKRQEEYMKARARIFSSSPSSAASASAGAVSSASASGQASNDSPGGAPGGSTAADDAVAAGTDTSPDLSTTGRTVSGSSAEQGGAVEEPYPGKGGKKKGKAKGGGGGGGSSGAGASTGAEGGTGGASGSGGKKPKPVAILRDRDKEKLDPDYRRGLDRFSQRFDPDFGMAPEPAPSHYGIIHPMYAPVMTYNSEFPALAPNQASLMPQGMAPLLGPGGVGHGTAGGVPYAGNARQPGSVVGPTVGPGGQRPGIPVPGQGGQMYPLSSPVVGPTANAPLPQQQPPVGGVSRATPGGAMFAQDQGAAHGMPSTWAAQPGGLQGPMTGAGQLYGSASHMDAFRYGAGPPIGAYGAIGPFPRGPTPSGFPPMNPAYSMGGMPAAYPAPQSSPQGVPPGQQQLGQQSGLGHQR